MDPLSPIGMLPGCTVAETPFTEMSESVVLWPWVMVVGFAVKLVMTGGVVQVPVTVTVACAVTGSQAAAPVTTSEYACVAAGLTATHPPDVIGRLPG